MRKLGAARYSQRQLPAAMAAYNKALSLAPPKGGQLAGLFANRALILLEQGAPGQALGQLKLAEMEGYPAKKKYKLLARKAVCLARLGQREAAKKIFLEAEGAVKDAEETEREAAKELVKKKMNEAQVTSSVGAELQTGDGWTGAAEEAVLASPNPIFPSLTSRVKVVETAGAGRHLVATQFIEAGHLVAVDTPSIVWLSNGRSHSNCLHCLASCPLPLPCPSCTSALFCSSVCRTKALESYHRFECKLGLADLANEEERRKLETSTVASGLFMVLRALTQESLEYFWDRKERIDKEIKGERDKTGDKEYRSTDYIRLLGLVKHPETDQLSLVRHIFIRRATFWLCGRL